MALFEVSTATVGQRPKRYGESNYAYYRDSERPAMEAIRHLLDLWFGEIPVEEQRDLGARFRSPIDRQHRSALFELFIRHFLLRSGLQVEFHPDLLKVTTHPDFLVRKEGRSLFYLEAVTVSNSFREEAENNRINQVYDTLNTLQSPDFYLSIRVQGAPETPPAGARLRSDLQRWLGGLDWEAVWQNYVAEQYEAIPKYEWEHEGWSAIFEPIPKSEGTRGSLSARPIGMTMPAQARQLTLDEELRDAVASKDRYGRVTLPLVIAVQVIDEFRIGKYEVMNGLWAKRRLLMMIGAVLDLDGCRTEYGRRRLVQDIRRLALYSLGQPLNLGYLQQSNRSWSTIHLRPIPSQMTPLL